MIWRITTRDIEGVTIVDVIGAKQDPSSIGLIDALNELLAKGPQRILLNLASVHRISKNGVGDLIHCYTNVVKQSGMLKLLNVQPKVYKMLEFINVSRIFEIFQDEEEAIRSFQDSKEGQ